MQLLGPMLIMFILMINDMQFDDISFDFSDKIVLIIGGSRGIGFGVLSAFVTAGAKVFYVSRNPIKKKIRDALHIKADLINESAIENIFKTTDKYGPIDILINSAAINYAHKFDSITSYEWDNVLNINLKSIFFICKEVISKMKQKKAGKIVNISSIAGRHRSYVSGAHYVASKAGLIGLTKQLAFEVAKYNININAVCPSQTLTDMLKKSMKKDELNSLKQNIPLQRIASVKDQVGPILFLCSDAASYITGTYIDINGGQI